MKTVKKKIQFDGYDFIRNEDNSIEIRVADRHVRAKLVVYAKKFGIPYEGKNTQTLGREVMNAIEQAIKKAFEKVA